MNNFKIVNCADDFIKKNIHVGDTVIYNNKHYTFNGLSAYNCDLKNIENMLSEIPKNNIDVQNKYIGKRFMYNNYLVEVLQQNKNGTYSLQAYDQKGKKHGGKFAILKQDTLKLKPVE